MAARTKTVRRKDGCTMKMRRTGRGATGWTIVAGSVSCPLGRRRRPARPRRTTRRRMFEAYHKTAGYFAVLFAIGATGSGLMQYPMPIFASVLLSLPFVFLVVWVVLEFFERRYDGYKAVHGYGLEHPYNKAREYL